MSSQDFIQNEKSKITPSSTVEELLKMIQGNSPGNKKQKPPPLPPKPKGELGITIESAKRSLGLLPKDDSSSSSRAFFRMNSSSNPVSGDKFDSTAFNPNNPSEPPRTRTIGRHDTEAIDNVESKPGHNITKREQQQVPPRAKASIGGFVVYDSTQTEPSLNNNDYLAKSTVTIEQDKNASKFRPFVTEYMDETYSISNNHQSNEDLPAGQASQTVATTVEILEMPNNTNKNNNIYRISNHHNHSSLRDDYNDNGRKSLNSDGSQKTDQQNKSTPFITPATDDDDSDNVVDFEMKLPMASTEATESIFSESTDGDGQPRTSTPTSSTNFHLQYNSTSSSGNSTGTNNNISSQNTYLSHGAKDSDSPVDDTLNISRETDELTNTSVHNQSGGCELIGINDISDSKEQSPPLLGHQSTTSMQDNSTHERTPYSVRMFNEKLMSSTSNSLYEKVSIGNGHNNTTESSDNFVATNNVVPRDPESEQLKKLVNTLQKEISHLNNKVANLTSKVDDLEFQLDVHRKENNVCSSRLTPTSTLGSTSSTRQRDRLSSPSSGFSKPMLSQSTSTISRLTPMQVTRHNNSSYGQTYSRNGVPLSSKRPQYDYDKSSQALPVRLGYSTGETTTPRSGIKHYTSTNSLHGGDNNNTLSSISPTFNQGLQSTLSPSSTLNLLREKRDLNTYTSMLSLSSLNYSTLKKGSIAGSVSNLSQIGGVNANLLAQWPSQSNFVQSSHQAKDVLYDECERVIRMVLYNTLITMRLPSWLNKEYNFDKLVHPPKVKLKLDWVHGYRGRDCRSNLYYLPTGECIYFVASIVVLYNAVEKTQRHYLGHTDNVKCLAIHPNKLIVASGQSAVLSRRDRRPIVRVWNTVNLATLRVIGFNEDFDRSICCLAFSRHDQGATLAVVDESSEHTITLLDWQREKNWRIAEANSGHEPVLAIDFHPMDKYAIVTVGKSSVNFWDIRGMTLAKKAGLFDKYDRPKYVLCFTFNDLGETITGDSNGNIIIWPRGANKPRRIIRDAHMGGVFSILAMKDGSYLTGGRDRRIIEWDESFESTGRQAELPEHCGGVRFITSGRGFQVLIGTIRNCILIGSLDSEFNVVMQGHTEATTALAIHPNQQKYLTGGFDDQIHLIDCATRQIEWSKCMSQPITAACYSANGMTLILGSVSGNWSVLDAITLEIIFEACDGTGTINCIKYSPDGQQFSLGSSDCHVYIYATNETANQFKRIGTCVGHSAPMKEIDWSEDSFYIQTQSMNFELMFWKTANCRQVDDEAIVHDLKWHTQSCTIGFNSMGIWSDSIDSALINYCDRSNSGDLVVSSTDTGYINVYKAPTYYNQCMSHKYYGNVDKFNFIKFLHDDTKLIAVGTKNCATTEWIIDRID